MGTHFGNYIFIFKCLFHKIIKPTFCKLFFVVYWSDFRAATSLSNLDKQPAALRSTIRLYWCQYYRQHVVLWLLERRWTRSISEWLWNSATAQWNSCWCLLLGIWMWWLVLPWCDRVSTSSTWIQSNNYLQNQMLNRFFITEFLHEYSKSIQTKLITFRYIHTLIKKYCN